MELKHIKTQVCPTCGSIPILEHQKNCHSNGQWNERREFHCGYIEVWSPNYKALTVSKGCVKDPAIEKIKEKRSLAKAKLNRYVNKIDVDIRYRTRLIEDIKFSHLCEISTDEGLQS